MSETYQRLIPTDPAYVPPPEAQEKAVAALREIIGEDVMVRAIVTEDIQFVDQGANFQHVSCPKCAVKLAGWWGRAMDAAYATKFVDLMTTCPACKAAVSLNELDYDWPAGFARFKLEADGKRGQRHVGDLKLGDVSVSVVEVKVNPGWLTDSQRQQLEAILGCKLREIWSHY